MPTSGYDRDLLTRHHRQSQQSRQSKKDCLNQASGHGSPDKICQSPVSVQNSPRGATITEPTGNTVASVVGDEILVNPRNGTVYHGPDIAGGTEPVFERPVTITATTTGIESFDLPATPNFLLGDSQSLQEFEFLWSDFPTDDQPLPASFFDTDLSLVDISQQYLSLPLVNRAVAGTPQDYTTDVSPDQSPFNDETQTHPLVSRFPSLEPSGQTTSSRPVSSMPEQAPVVCPWRISLDEYQELSKTVAVWPKSISQSFTFPSRHTLSRYLEGYFRGFHAHMPMLHTATLTLVALGPELVLSLAAVGALYRFEHSKGVEIYRVAKALIGWRLDQLHEETVARLTSTSPRYAGFAQAPRESQHDPPSPILSEGQRGLHLLQGLLVLMAITSWGERTLVRDALSMASQVATLVREFGISTPEDATTRDTCWEDWIRTEE
ncbi:hypothetical protein FDECE_362 [Fusarium decemcellulare]|nr:hypothetical protein FDECE_362 [Fusarium decemcellulare]